MTHWVLFVLVETSIIEPFLDYGGNNIGTDKKKLEARGKIRGDVDEKPEFGA